MDNGLTREEERMGKIAFVFPGQGAQYPGMGREAVESCPAAAAVFDDGSKALGLDLRELVFNGTEESLKITENTQPAIVAASLACMQPLLEAGILPDMAAGLSLGEYCAHVAAGTFSAGDAIALVRRRGKLMQEAVPAGVGTMAAILGLSDEQVLEVCEKASAAGIVEPANFNCPGQIVIAGEVQAVEAACLLAKEAGAKRAMVLQVSAPFHCSMLRPAGEKLAAELDRISLGEMTIPVVANVTGAFIASSADVKDLLVRQVSTPVRWEACVRTLIEAGADTFVEIGPGKVLNGFIRKIDKNVSVFNADSRASIDETIAALKGRQ
jgi:[acyl-carrier-protein] S-malonyltransferase